MRRRLSFVCVFALLLHAPISWSDEPPTDDAEYVVLRGEPYKIYPAELLRKRGVNVPDVTREQNAAFVYFDAVNAMPDDDPELFEALSAASDGEWPEGELADRMNAYLDSSAEAMRLARTGSQMEGYFLPLFGDETAVLWELLLPSLSHQRRLTIVLAADAHRRARAGDPEGAVEHLLTAQRMGNHLGHGSTLIEGLVGIAVGSVASDRLAKFAETYDIPSDILTAAVAEMEASAADMPTFDELSRAEHALSQSFIDDMMDDPTKFGMITNGIPPGVLPIDYSGANWKKLASALRRVYLPDRAMKRNLNNYYDRIEQGTRKQKDGTPGSILEEDKLIEAIPAWDVVNYATIPSLAYTYEATLRYESNFERAKLRVATEAYRKDNGRMPPTLEALTPAYVRRINADPLTGYDFDYRPEKTPSGDIVGLEIVTRDSADELRKKRRTPAILTPRASKWRRYTMNYIERYELDAAQRNSAESILRDVEAKATIFERAQGAKLKELIERGDTETARNRMGPLDSLFDELTKRLDRLPTASQRAAVANSENGDD